MQPGIAKDSLEPSRAALQVWRGRGNSMADFSLEHDLFGKPATHPRIKSEGMLFRIMLARKKTPAFAPGFSFASTSKIPGRLTAQFRAGRESGRSRSARGDAAPC